MQIYSFILIGMMTVIVLGLSVFTIRTNCQQANQRLDDVTLRMSESIDQRDSVLTNVLSQIALNTSDYDNLRHYMTLDPPEYFDYTSELWETMGINTHFSNTLKSILSTYADIEEIDIVLEESDSYLNANRQHPNGIKIYGRPKMNEQLFLFRTFKNPNSGESSGEIYLTFKKEGMKQNKEYQKHVLSPSTFILDNDGTMLYEDDYNNMESFVKELYRYPASPDNWKELDRHYFYRNVSTKNMTVLTIMSKQQLWIDIFVQLLPILAIGIGSSVTLLLVLKKVFTNYTRQVGAIVEVTDQVSQGRLDKRIDTSHLQLELCDLAEAINVMIGSINTYIDDIYLLEIKQRDAQMEALQSQINPHFLYNTLEYIRMYALSQQQEELADVVYAFSALLRNNTTQAKTSSLKEELNFCEKYVFLYQMRYPDSIAYHFDMDVSLEELTVPKFIIQPLVENYFVHGIDYSRQDNALSVKALRDEAENIVIKIIDNGKGIPAARLMEIREELLSDTSVVSDSIGIKNVYQRLTGYFQGECEMTIDAEVDKGTTITIKMNPKGAKKYV